MAVSQSAKQPHQNPMAPPPEAQPLMMVFGDASWVSNKGLSQSNLNLFVSCLSWLRERSDIGATAEATPIREFQLSGLDANDTNRLLYLPAELMILAIITLGIGVWVVRRR